MKILTHKYESQPDGTWKITEGFTEGDAQAERCQQMAEAQPGRIVVGWKKTDDGKVEVEDEKYLDECSGEPRA